MRQHSVMSRVGKEVSNHGSLEVAVRERRSIGWMEYVDDMSSPSSVLVTVLVRSTSHSRFIASIDLTSLRRNIFTMLFSGKSSSRYLKPMCFLVRLSRKYRVSLPAPNEMICRSLFPFSLPPCRMNASTSLSIATVRVYVPRLIIGSRRGAGPYAARAFRERGEVTERGRGRRTRSSSQILGINVTDSVFRFLWKFPLAAILPSIGMTRLAVKMYPSLPPLLVIIGCVRPGKTCHSLRYNMQQIFKFEIKHQDRWKQALFSVTT